MNELKKIFTALKTLKRVPPSASIRAAWDLIFSETSKINENNQLFSDALDLIGSVVNAVVLVAEHVEKSAKKGAAS